MSRTNVSVRADQFFINGRPTYEGRQYMGSRIEGLLINSRMVQAIFDDENPQTRHLWAYPDTGEWNPERNVREFLDAMPTWRKFGLIGITVGLQGGCPQGYCKEQPWINTALAADGSLKPEYLDRLKRIIDRADELGMIVILSIYYFGQDQHIKDEAAVISGAENTVRWILMQGYGNVLIEVANECDIPRYDHAILQPHRIHELIAHLRTIDHEGRRLLVGTSYKGGAIPSEEVVAVSDVVYLHGNGVENPDQIAGMVGKVRSLGTYRPMPIVFNEDDHFEFDQSSNNLSAALGSYASWGYYDGGPGSGGHHAVGDYVEGFQNVPVNWAINTPVKQAFFDKVREITGS